MRDLLRNRLSETLHRCCPARHEVTWSQLVRRMQLARRDADPYLNNLGLKICTACAMLQAFEMIRRDASRVECPIIAFHGARDRVCPLAAVQRLLDSGVASEDTRLVTLPEGLHDILHDPEGPEIRAGMVEWMDAHGALAA